MSFPARRWGWWPPDCLPQPAAAYVVSGKAANLSRAGVYTLACAKGTYTVSGQAAVLASGRVLVAARGTIALTGVAAGVRRT